MNTKYMKQGFTLVELLVTIAIIGILAAIGVTAFSGSQTKARDAKRRGDIGTISTSLALYYNANADSYPLQTPDAGLVSSSLLAVSEDPADGFSLPKSPQTLNNGDYFYVSDTFGTMISLFTKLEKTDDWYIRNSLGFAGDVPTVNTDDPTTAGRTLCDRTANATYVYQPCLAQPVM